MVERRLISDLDIERARAIMGSDAERPLNKAVRFHSALKALLMDARRNQRDGSARTVFAADPVEIVATINPSMNHYRAFTFGDLLDQPRNQEWRQSLSELDRLVSYQLFAASGHPFLLLDSYCEELVDLRHGAAQDTMQAEDRVFANMELAKNAFSGFTKPQIENIRNHILNDSDRKQIKSELDQFFVRFMPHWRADLFDSLRDSERHVGSLDAFLSGSDFVFIRNNNYGRRSLARLLPGIDWEGFSSFLNLKRIEEESSEIRRAVHDIASQIKKYGMKEAALSKAAMNDGHALADLHVLNSFLEESDDERRVELVSRSSILPNILNALPSGSIKVQIRHPLLLPEAFRFGDAAIDAVADISQRFEAVIAPYLDEYNEPEEQVVSEEIGRAETRDRRVKDAETLERASEIARDLIKWLMDSSMIQMGTQLPREVFRGAYVRTLGNHNSKKADHVSEELIGDIQSLFGLMVDRLGDGANPFTQQALTRLIEENKVLAEMVWDRALPANSSLPARTLLIEEGSPLSSVSCIAIRIVEGKQTRLFHLHSTRVQDTLLKSVLGKRSRSSSKVPIEVHLSRAETINSFKALLETLATKTEDDPTDDDVTYMIDVTLLVAVALASRGELSASISIASTVIHELMAQLRRSNVKLANLSMSNKLRLAWQELLMFRHYSERQVGISEFILQEKHSTVTFIRGSVERNFARAQRDLDLAAELGWVGDINSPARIVSDIRLRLIHMAGWLDMYLMTAKLDLLSMHDNFERPLVRLTFRRDIWTAIGLVKESLDDVERIKQILKAIPSGDRDNVETERYLRHVEARLLQNALVALIALVFKKDTPMAGRLLDPILVIHPDQVLKFDHWESWWKRYCELVTDFGFKLRLIAVIDPVARMLASIDEIRRKGGISATEGELTDEERINGANSAWLLAISEINEIKETQGTFSHLLANHIISGLEHQIERSKRLRQTAI